MAPRRVLIIVLILAIGYIVGAKWPMMAQRFGVA